jgi:hypothetical protein
MDNFFNALEASDKEFLRLFDIFVQELTVFNKQIKNFGDQTWRRAYTRSLFSMIETLIYRLKEDIYNLLESEGSDISSEIEGKLKGQIIKRNKQGQIKIRRCYQSLLNSIEYAYSHYAYMHYIDYKIDKNSPGWQWFLKSLKIRNRITHPKETADLEINNDELIIIQSAGKWFLETLNDLYEKCATSVFDLADALERNWNVKHLNI